MFLIKKCSENKQQIYRRTPMLKCDFNKVTLEIYLNQTSAQMFFCKFATYFQNIFSLEHIQRASSSFINLLAYSRKSMHKKSENLMKLKCRKRAGYYVTRMTQSKTLVELMYKNCKTSIYLRFYVYFQLWSQSTVDESGLLICTFTIYVTSSVRTFTC